MVVSLSVLDCNLFCYPFCLKNALSSFYKLYKLLKLLFSAGTMLTISSDTCAQTHNPNRILVLGHQSLSNCGLSPDCDMKKVLLYIIIQAKQ